MKTVLIITANEALYTLLCFGLSELSCKFMNAKNGKIGIQKLSTYPIDFVITDNQMPITSGLDVISWIKKHHPNIPVCFMSAHQHMGKVACELGADLFVEKPFNSEILSLREFLEDS